MKVICDGRVIAENVHLVDSFWSRFWGLMGKKSLGDEEGILLTRCSSIHCFFMKIPIDAVYLSKNMTVLGTETLKPWRVGRYIKGTANVLELKAGRALVSSGEVLEINCDGGKPYDGNK
ncbi:MAG: hypothetical protein CVU91_09825 [Firmicutes bacterium HGW-Firmicutes-16]|nr:MAG: hypothetical protein CVU91_09825 [Firmicutes bacterium HGW-Firmicutes-16]